MSKRFDKFVERKREYDMDEKTKIELEAQAFRGLVNHLRQRTDVQNIDMMILTGFCRNCLAKWYRKAALERNIEMDYDEAREAIYGMPYEEWKEKYQTEATQEQYQALKKADKAVI